MNAPRDNHYSYDNHMINKGYHIVSTKKRNREFIDFNPVINKGHGIVGLNIS